MLSRKQLAAMWMKKYGTYSYGSLAQLSALRAKQKKAKIVRTSLAQQSRSLPIPEQGQGVRMVVGGKQDFTKPPVGFYEPEKRAIAKALGIPVNKVSSTSYTETTGRYGAKVLRDIGYVKEGKKPVKIMEHVVDSPELLEERGFFVEEPFRGLLDKTPAEQEYLDSIGGVPTSEDAIAYEMRKREGKARMPLSFKRYVEELQADDAQRKEMEKLERQKKMGRATKQSQIRGRVPIKELRRRIRDKVVGLSFGGLLEKELAAPIDAEIIDEDGDKLPGVVFPLSPDAKGRWIDVYVKKVTELPEDVKKRVWKKVGNAGAVRVWTQGDTPSIHVAINKVKEFGGRSNIIGWDVARISKPKIKRAKKGLTGSDKYVDVFIRDVTKLPQKVRRNVREMRANSAVVRLTSEDANIRRLVKSLESRKKHPALRDNSLTRMFGGITNVNDWEILEGSDIGRVKLLPGYKEGYVEGVEKLLSKYA